METRSITASSSSSPRIRRVAVRPASAVLDCSMNFREKRNFQSLKCMNRTLPLSRFTRSLKLLGLDPKEFGIESARTDNKECRKVQDSHRSSGTLSTRLTRRSVSLNDLSETVAARLVESHGMLDCTSREQLSQAVYEEWYFRKLEEAKRKKMEEDQEKKKRETEEQQAKEQLRLKCEQNFSEWKQKKQSAHKRRTLAKNSKKEDDKKYTREEIEAAMKAWQKEKDVTLRKRAKEKKNEMKKRLEEKREKTEEAQMAFQYWKGRADEVLERKKKEERNKIHDKEEEKRRRETEKKDIAKYAFKAWLSKKKLDLQQRRFEENSETYNLETQVMKTKEERLNAAQRAFEEWLDEIDVRQETSSDQQLDERPPWYPVGRSLSFSGS